MSNSDLLIRDCHPLLDRHILVFETRYVNGWGKDQPPPPRQSEYGRSLWGSPTPASRFLKKKHQSDACVVSYMVRNEEGEPEPFPLLKVDGVPNLKQISGSCRVEWLCIDVDTPRHAPATVDWLVAQRELVRAFHPGAFYGTRSGYRVVWPLRSPLQIDEFKRFFAWFAGGLRKGPGKKQTPIGTLDGVPCPGELRKAGIHADTACQSFNWRYFAPACKKVKSSSEGVKEWEDVQPTVCDFSDVQEIDPEESRDIWSRVETGIEDDRDRTPIDINSISVDRQRFAAFLWACCKKSLAEKSEVLRGLSEGRNIYIRNAVSDLTRDINVIESLNPGVQDSALSAVENAILEAGEAGARELKITRDPEQSRAAIRSGIRHAAADPWGAEWLDAAEFRYEIIVLRK